MQSVLNTYQNSTFSGSLTYGKSDLNARSNFLDEVSGEGNYISFKYRGYDPRIGRFSQVDPLASKYPFYSPYAFAGNRVIDKIELEGLEPADFEVQKGMILEDVKKHNVITRTNQQYVIDGIKQRGYALHSEIGFFTQKPYSSSWSTSQAKTNKDLGLNVRADGHENAQKRDGYYGVGSDAPGPHRIYIPGNDLLPVVEEYPKDETEEIDFEKQKGFSWMINPDDVTTDGITGSSLTNINIAIQYAIKHNSDIVVYGGSGDNATSANQMLIDHAVSSGIDPSKIKMASSGGEAGGIKVVGVGSEDNKTIE